MTKKIDRNWNALVRKSVYSESTKICLRQIQISFRRWYHADTDQQISCPCRTRRKICSPWCTSDLTHALSRTIATVGNKHLRTNSREYKHSSRVNHKYHLSHYHTCRSYMYVRTRALCILCQPLILFNPWSI